ncbi:MAG: Fic family protein [Mariprofundaceae bacterium]|nr:Fic family protein [Mariprofundaceae bacterium]
MVLDEANRLVGELNAYSQLLPNVDFFIQMHITKEATTSSRIEGTQTNMEDALIDVQDIDPEKRSDWQEVQNYIKAMNQAIAELEKLPLSNRLLKETHRALMMGVRGKDKQPEEFRSSQNWIGSSLKHATFVPPHHERLPDLMGDMEKFIHNDVHGLPHLIKIAMAHYQFETIHPFLDGNGRLGRLMITLYLVSFNLLSKPSLYLSDFFERHKGEYYDHLMAVRTTNNMRAWVLFFLAGVQETATNSIQVFKDIFILKEQIEREKLPRLHLRKQENAAKLMLQLYKRPIVTINLASDLLGIGHNTAAALISDFEKMGILKEVSGSRRNRLYVFEPYVKLFVDME